MLSTALLRNPTSSGKLSDKGIRAPLQEANAVPSMYDLVIQIAYVQPK